MIRILTIKQLQENMPSSEIIKPIFYDPKAFAQLQTLIIEGAFSTRREAKLELISRSVEMMKEMFNLEDESNKDVKEAITHYRSFITSFHAVSSPYWQECEEYDYPGFSIGTVIENAKAALHDFHYKIQKMTGLRYSIDDVAKLEMSIQMSAVEHNIGDVTRYYAEMISEIYGVKRESEKIKRFNHLQEAITNYSTAHFNSITRDYSTNKPTLLHEEYKENLERDLTTAYTILQLALVQDTDTQVTDVQIA